MYIYDISRLRVKLFPNKFHISMQYIASSLPWVLNTCDNPGELSEMQGFYRGSLPSMHSRCAAAVVRFQMSWCRILFVAYVKQRRGTSFCWVYHTFIVRFTSGIQPKVPTHTSPSTGMLVLIINFRTTYQPPKDRQFQ